MKEKSIVFDMDDTICFPNHSEKDSYEKYGLAKPNLPLIKKMQQMAEDGWYITISSARRMLTHDGDVEKIIADIGIITTSWLSRHGVPYNEIHFGKPYASTYYVDDKAMTLDQFASWNYNEED